MVNPFCDSSKVNILREAFPSVRISLIEDKLLSVDGDVNRAFELLLEMTDPSQSVANGPPLPDRPLHTNYSSNPPDIRKSLPNPFLNKPVPAKPLSVREELNQWRQDLREESRQRTNSLRNNTASTPNSSFSNMFKSNSSRSSLQERNRDNHRSSSSQSSHSVAQPSFRRPLVPSSITTGHIPNFMHSTSTPSVTYQTHSRSTSNPAYHPSPTSFRPNLSPPALPRRRQSSNSLGSNHNNPFLTANNNSHSHRPVPFTPPVNPNHRESSDNEPSSFNPFEEPELPPPAYNEIQRDQVINLAP